MSLMILLILLCGIGAGMLLPEEIGIFLDQASSFLLPILLFSVGIDMGRNRDVFVRMKEMGGKILLIPFGIVIGSLCGGGLTALILQMPLREGMAISSGLGWYSLSGILLTEAGNPTGGTISFLANIFREMITFIIVPFLASHVNGYCAIAPAGATAMDTTLGIISKHTNATITMLSFVSGITCTFVVPILIPLFL